MGSELMSSPTYSISFFLSFDQFAKIMLGHFLAGQNASLVISDNMLFNDTKCADIN